MMLEPHRIGRQVTILQPLLLNLQQLKRCSRLLRTGAGVVTHDRVIGSWIYNNNNNNNWVLLVNHGLKGLIKLSPGVTPWGVDRCPRVLPLVTAVRHR
jgi:hypothetical protein